MLDRKTEANQAIHQALKLGINDSIILRSLGAAFLERNQPEAAVEALRMALELEPASQTTKTAFQNALNAASRNHLVINDHPVDMKVKRDSSLLA